MQGQGSGIDTFSEITDVGLGPVSNSTGEPSSRLNLQNTVNDGGIRMVQDWLPAPHSACPVTAQRSEDTRIEPNILFPGRSRIGLGGNQITGRPSFSEGSSSNYIPQHVNLNAGYVENSSNYEHGMEADIDPKFYKSSGLGAEHTSSGSASHDIIGTSSRSSDYMVGEDDGNPGSSSGNWGLSCKRKALEGTSQQSYPGGSSSSFSEAENRPWNTGPACHNPSSSLSLSTPRNSPSGLTSEQQNSRTRIGLRVGASENFSSLGAMGNAESPLRQYVRSFSNTGSLPESATSNLLSAGRSTTVAATNSSAPESQSPAMHMNRSSGSMFPFPWNSASSSRVGSLSGSLMSGHRGTELREEASSQSNSRINVEHPLFVAVSEMRNSAQDPTGWSLAPGNLSTSIDAPSSARVGSSSSIHSLPNPSWIPPLTENPRINEFAPWSSFPSIEPRGRNHYSTIPPGPSASSQDSGTSSGPNNQGRLQSVHRSAFLLDRQGDDVLNTPHSLRAIAADIDGRRRLISEIRQVLNAMRRGENLRVEDYMLFDPFIYHGMAEMHDRHRDMRLDVDNMSYEELLALEEHIGDVSTGLSEETISKLMKQRKCLSITTEFPADMEPCCICQEQYADGDDIGTLDCGHDFHTNCIKQWLMQKNLCPICKTPALVT
ncbi:E3 ubiquitin-protein ligase MBR2-like [Argentina anserina]|uniref:E3 ubiquitin-protein ligase MBR2-like n=1 Tax=Argentina anserina TaxID=57926 RepID=UPI0021767571|nr:E3 ubiquitin-protein ligase MBR2-like [Potentilla anserina]